MTPTEKAVDQAWRAVQALPCWSERSPKPHEAADAAVDLNAVSASGVYDCNKSANAPGISERSTLYRAKPPAEGRE